MLPHMGPADELLLMVGGAPGWTARGLQRAAAGGELTRLYPGVYVATGRLEGMRRDERALLRAKAYTMWCPEAVLSHRSAALAHGMPLVMAPELPEVVRPATGRGGTRQGVRRRATSSPVAPVRIGELSAVPLERTLVDLAASLPLRESLAPLDAHLRGGGERKALRDLLESISVRGHRRAERAIALADGRAANAGESLSRATILELGFPAPELQASVPGMLAETDFAWLEFGVRGEMDGHAKYRDPQFTRGRTAAEVVIAQKRREDAIRAATGHRFARWSFEDALRVHPLRSILLQAGLPQLRGRRSR